MVFFRQPPSWVSRWCPSLFVVHDVLYFCADQFVMAGQTSIFQVRYAKEVIMSSPDPWVQKRIDRGVRNIDNAIWD